MTDHQSEYEHWSAEAIAEGRPQWDDPVVRALAVALHREPDPCEWCLTLAAHTVRTCRTNPEQVRALLAETGASLTERLREIGWRAETNGLPPDQYDIFRVAADRIDALEAENAALRTRVEQAEGLLRRWSHATGHLYRPSIDADTRSWLAAASPSPAPPEPERECVAEGHWTRIFDTETHMVEDVHDPDDGPCEFAAPAPEAEPERVTSVEDDLLNGWRDGCR